MDHHYYLYQSLASREIWSSHRGKYREDRFPECKAIQFGR